MANIRDLRRHFTRYKIARWISTHPVWMHRLIKWLYDHTAGVRNVLHKVYRQLKWLRFLSPSNYLKRLDWYIVRKFIGTYVFAIALTWRSSAVSMLRSKPSSLTIMSTSFLISLICSARCLYSSP